jgi:hypothetical protein
VGVLTAVQIAEDDDLGLLGLVVEDDVLLDPDGTAAGEAVVAWLADPRMVSEAPDRSGDRGPVGRRLLLSPGSARLHRDVFVVAVGFAGEPNGGSTGRHRDSATRRGGNALLPSGRCPAPNRG